MNLWFKLSEPTKHRNVRRKDLHDSRYIQCRLAERPGRSIFNEIYASQQPYGRPVYDLDRYSGLLATASRDENHVPVKSEFESRLLNYFSGLRWC
jgi:hypothetical protein